jgi:hypothetical protein
MIRIFVGSAAGDDIESQAVLEYSLRMHASQPLDIVWMQQSADRASPFHGWRTERWSTPFSGFRWAVPELCGFEGKAIYMDSDIVVMADIAELWDQPFEPGKAVLAKGGADPWRFCVSLWDCAAAGPHMKPIADMKRDPGAHQAMQQMFASSRIVQPFTGNWNCIDGEDFSSIYHPAIRAIHYSSEAHQPHLKYAVPRLKREGRKQWFDGKMKMHWRPQICMLFDRLLDEAKANGFAPERYAPANPPPAYKIASHNNYRSHRWAPQ